jgi:hypothetical protein
MGLSIVWLIFLTFLATCQCPGARANSQKLPPFKITAIKAMLFYEDKGTFSQDILADPSFALRNVIIGAGSAEGNSSSTLVIVELSAKPEAYAPTRKIEFTATYKSSGKNSRRIIEKRISNTGIFNKQGRFFAAFWLYDTGCEPVRVSTRIIGQSEPSFLTKTINFDCGE